MSVFYLKWQKTVRGIKLEKMNFCGMVDKYTVGSGPRTRTPKPNFIDIISMTNAGFAKPPKKAFEVRTNIEYRGI